MKNLEKTVRPNRAIDLEDILILGKCLGIGIKEIEQEIAECEDWQEKKALRASVVRAETMQKYLREEYMRRNTALSPLEEI